MKSCCLFPIIFLIFAIQTAWGQGENQSSTNGTINEKQFQNTNILEEKVVLKPVSGLPVSFHKITRPNSVQSGNSSMRISTLGQSVNPYTVSLQQNIPVISYDPKTKALVLARRGGPNDPDPVNQLPGNNLFYDYSVNGGHSWKLSRGPVYPAPAGFGVRYPGVVLTNPQNDADTNHLFAAYAGSRVNLNPGGSSPWGGLVKGKRKLSGDNSTLSTETDGNFIINNIGKNASGDVFVLEALTTGSLPEVYTNQISLKRGIINPATEDIVWSEQIINLPDISPQEFEFGSASIVFAPTGQLGYITLVARLKDTIRCPMENYYPIVLYTQDGGTTWSPPFVADPTFAADFKIARLFLIGDSSNLGVSGPGINRIRYTTLIEQDAAVDFLGNLHFFIGLSPAGPTTSTGNVYYPAYVYHFDILVNPNMLSQNRWRVIPIFKPQASRGIVGDVQNSNNIIYNNRIQVSTSANGSELVFAMYDTDTILHAQTNAYRNQNPDLFAKSMRITGGEYWLSEIDNLTLGSDIEGLIHFGRLANLIDKHGDSLLLFQSSCLLSPFPGNISVWPIQHLFQRISWVPSNYVLVPEFSGVHTISGRLFEDINGNCVADSNEIGLANSLIKAGDFFTTTNQNGYYNLSVPSGTHSIRYINPAAQMGYISSCFPNFTLPAITINSSGFVHLENQNIPVATFPCSQLSVSGSLSILRPCRPGTVHIVVKNLGTVPVNDGVLKITLPVQLKFNSASIPGIWDEGTSVFSCTLPLLNPGQNLNIEIFDSLRCNTGLPLGSVLCVSSSVSFPGTCIPSDSAWDQVNLSVTAECNNTLPRFRIFNQGAHMNASRQYRLFKDSLLVFQNGFQLASMNSLTLQVPNPDPFSTYRLETNQSANYPGPSVVGANIHCGNSLSPLPISSPTLLTNQSEACGIIRTSFDPNDKAVWPPGAGPEGKILPTSWLDYKIRFMNKGNDTAFNVVVVDSLSPDLDISSFTETIASHHYQLKVLGSNPYAIHFQFFNILLPDSITNLEGSQGFVCFRIKPKDGTPLETVIKNRAAIYFDFNPPVMTNFTQNTLFNPALTPGIVDSLEIISRTNPMTIAPGLQLFPNPARDRFTVQGPELLWVEVISPLGQVLLRKQEESTREIEMNTRNLAKGLYWVRISERGGAIHIRKLVID